MTTERKFHLRAFVTLLTTFSFLVLALSGLVLFIEPHGRIAYWTDWRLLGLGKQHWDSIHISSAALFLVAASFHLYLNWKVFVCFLKGKAQKSKPWSRELLISLGVMLLFLLGSITWFQPFAAFFQLNEQIKGSWSTAAAEQPPFGHAELASIAALCRNQQLELQPALARLRAAGFAAKSDAQTVKELAVQHQVTPREIFAALQGSSRARPAKGRQPVGRRRNAAAEAGEHQQGPRSPAAERLFQHFAGRGLGRQSMGAVCEALGLDEERGLAALSRQGIRASRDQPLKSVAQASGLRPSQVLDLLCQEGGCKLSD